ncbi:MAG: two component transcriptional regulator, LuxR family [Ilumatobacteraceae bacterium]|nr:two component transcriptional regulator, LuxR family [Ilumatobacteraceae bacterium]
MISTPNTATAADDVLRKLRVFLLDDHEIVRRGVRDLLERAGDIEVIGEAGTANEALQRIPTAWPDVAVLDVRLPDGSGVEVCRALISQRPQLRCLMLTSFDDDRALIDSILAGAMGYVLKEVRGGVLVDSIRRVASGESLLDPHASSRVIDRLRNPTPEDPRVAGLSPQERRILALLAESLTNRQIAARMFLAEKTVKNYVSHLLLKLDMRGRTEAAVFASRLDADA